MKYILVLLLVILLYFPAAYAYNHTSSYFLTPNYQGNYISLVPNNKQIYLTIFIPPKNLNELYFIAQKK